MGWAFGGAVVIGIALLLYREVKMEMEWNRHLSEMRQKYLEEHQERERARKAQSLN